MYQEFFRFNQSPFSIAPDPGFLYLSSRHREALAHLMYGMRTDGGFVLITGEIGTGKTTLIRSVTEQVPSDLEIAFILNPRLTVTELLETLCDELGVVYPRDRTLSVKHYIDHLNRHLLESHAQGRNTVLVIDEAQNLPPEVLEQIRLLTNLETNHHKLLRVILVGQPELDAMLERRELRQLAQRITARCHLTALDREESRAYIAHRLALAGGALHVFTAPALRELCRLSGGVPRLINTIADRALLGAYVEGRIRVNRRILKGAARELSGGPRPARRRWLAGAAAALVLAGGTWTLQQGPWQERPGIGGAFATLLGDRDPGAPGNDRTTPEDAMQERETAAGAAPELAERAREEATQRYRIIAPGAQVRFTDGWPEGSLEAIDARGDDGNDGAGIGQRIIRPQGTAAPSPLQRPAGLGVGEVQRHAYRALFEAWGRPFTEADIPCNAAPVVGLQCLRRSGGWEELLRTNRPAVLELHDEQGGIFHAALLHRDNDELAVRVGEQDLRVSSSQLRERWSGNYVVLWKMPPGYRGSVQAGDEQPVVSWLRAQLSRLLEKELEAEAPARFDEALEAALREFQRRNELNVDGVAGPATWMQLQGKVADVPRLDRGGYALSQRHEGAPLRDDPLRLDAIPVLE